jgi:transcriptional regulator
MPVCSFAARFFPIDFRYVSAYSYRNSICREKGGLVPRTDLLRGTLDLLILQALTLEPNHGLGVARRVQQLTQGAFQVNPGSLFPALHRLEQRGWLKSEWGSSDTNRKAKYYELTAAGRRQLRAETKNWERIAVAIGRALRPVEEA